MTNTKSPIRKIFFIAFYKTHYVIYYIVGVPRLIIARQISSTVNLFPSKYGTNEILPYLSHIFPDYLCQAGMLFVPSLYN